METSCFELSFDKPLPVVAWLFLIFLLFPTDSCLPFQDLMKTLKKNKTVKNQLYSKYEKSGMFLCIEPGYS